MEDKNKQNIIYSVSVSTEKKYKEIFADSKNKPGQQIQKYHRLLLDGLSYHKDIHIDVVSKLPVTSQNYNKKLLKKDCEKVGNATFYYIPIINLPIIRNFISFFYTLLYLVKCNIGKDTVVIGDILNITTSIANLVFGKIKGVKTIAIVTDIPSLLHNSGKSTNKFKGLISTLIYQLNEYILCKFDSYIFLTEQMNSLVNKNNKPYIVLEGLVDINMGSIPNSKEEKYDKKVCMYTGSLKKIYGIKMLTQAFIDAKIENGELHIYGDGDFEDELKNICKENKNIKYFGVKLNDYIVKEQLKSTLLINPRPTHEEYTKYSFPSKNMEYMVSGTPTLTTKLPGMPAEYNDYVFLIESETVEGIKRDIKTILSKPKEELNEKGLRAKEFVLSNKNNIIQSSKILDMIKVLIRI